MGGRGRRRYRVPFDGAVGRDPGNYIALDLRSFRDGHWLENPAGSFELTVGAARLRVVIGRKAVRWDVECDRTFAGEFEFGPAGLTDVPAERTFWFPGGHRTGESDGLIVGVQPAGDKPWIGVFADGGLYPDGGRSHAVAMPDRRSIVVVSKGTGYRVAVDEPTDWETLPVPIVKPPVSIGYINLVLFLWFTDIVAWGVTGKAWETHTTIADDLEVTGILGSKLFMTGSDPPGTTRSFTVDLTTGATTEDPVVSSDPD